MSGRTAGGRSPTAGTYSPSRSATRRSLPPAPPVSLKTTKDGASFKKGKKVKAKYVCSDANGRADVKSCTGTIPNGKRIATGKSGRHSFTVVAVDRVGNRTTKTVHYTVFKKKKKKK